MKNLGLSSMIISQFVEPLSIQFSCASDCVFPLVLEAGDTSQCALFLLFGTDADGTYRDTLRIQCDAANSIDGFCHISLSGTQISTPLPPTVVISKHGGDVRLTWSTVDHSESGCPVNVTGYLVFYSPNVDGPYYYHGYTDDTTYTHTRVFYYNYGMYYQVHATTEPELLLLQLPKYDEHSPLLKRDIFECLRSNRRLLRHQ